MYGPITTVRRENRVVKDIPWSAFKMMDTDWTRVVDARDILGVGKSLNSHLTLINESVRILTESSNISPPKSSQPSGGRFPLSRNFKQHGRTNATVQNMLFMGTLSLPVFKR